MNLNHLKIKINKKERLQVKLKIELKNLHKIKTAKIQDQNKILSNIKNF